MSWKVPESLWQRRYRRLSHHSLSLLIRSCRLIVKSFKSFAQDVRHSLTILHIPQYSQHADRWLYIATERGWPGDFEESVGGTVSRDLDGKEGASKSRGEKWVITTNAGSLHLPPGPWTAAVKMLNPRFTPKKLPKSILNTVTFYATGHSSEEADLKTLAGASEVTVTKVPLGYVGHSSKKRVHQWIITTECDKSFKRQEKSWAAVLGTLTPRFTHPKFPVPNTDSVSFSVIPEDAEGHPLARVTAENSIFAEANTVTANKITHEEYLKCCPLEAQISHQACPYRLQSEDGIPSTEVLASSWDDAAKYLYPRFATLSSQQPKEECTIIKPVIWRKLRPRADYEAGSGDAAQAEGAGSEDSDAEEGGSEGGRASQLSTWAGGVEAEREPGAMGTSEMGPSDITDPVDDTW
jgi:hypothetical protein